MDQTEVQQLIHQALSQQEQLLSTTISELRAELIATKAELSSIKTKIIDSLLARQTTDVRPKPVLPDVDKFDGSLSMWEVWYPEIQAKLRIDDLTFCQSEEVKFWYIYNRLRRKYKLWLHPSLRQPKDGRCTNTKICLTNLPGSATTRTPSVTLKTNWDHCDSFLISRSISSWQLSNDNCIRQKQTNGQTMQRLLCYAGS